MAYMCQDEVFLSEISAREHLEFMATLRMSRRSASARQQRVNTVLQELGLTACADQVIGHEGDDNGLSRNERKRLNFATETLTEPSLLLVDEPTTGLDTALAASVVRQLKTMATGGKIVVCTIHQPSEEIWSTFDKLVFLADGRTAYSGPIDEAQAYFKTMGLTSPAEVKGLPR